MAQFFLRGGGEEIKKLTDIQHSIHEVFSFFCGQHNRNYHRAEHICTYNMLTKYTKTSRNEGERVLSENGWLQLPRAAHAAVSELSRKSSPIIKDAKSRFVPISNFVCSWGPHFHRFLLLLRWLSMKRCPPYFATKSASRRDQKPFCFLFSVRCAHHIQSVIRHTTSSAAHVKMSRMLAQPSFQFRRSAQPRTK